MKKQLMIVCGAMSALAALAGKELPEGNVKIAEKESVVSEPALLDYAAGSVSNSYFLVVAGGINPAVLDDLRRDGPLGELFSQAFTLPPPPMARV